MPIPNLNSGALAPVNLERDQEQLQVQGSIPEALNGTLVRNGPNPFSGRFEGEDMLAWWPEAAMLHGITLRNGRALHYRNRWARTQAWAEHHKEPKADTFLATNPNVNVIEHAGETLALAEGGLPLVINRQLESLGPSLAHAAFAAGSTAHPKIDLQTGELFSFCSNWMEPWLRYFACDRSGATLVDQHIDVPGPAMTHDMAITKRFAVLMDLSVGYDFSLLEQGYRIPICWQPERASRIALVPRLGGEPIWFELASCFIQHVVNAYDSQDGSVILDVAHYPWYLRLQGDNFEPNPLARLRRYELNPGTGVVVETEMDDNNIELPRINDLYCGREYRYCYAVEQPTDAEMRGVVRYDLATGASQHFLVEPGDQNSEPVYVAKPSATGEDDGWLLVCVYRKASDTTDLVILNAQDLGGEPQAIVQVPWRIPAGFHGAWLPDSP